MKNKILLSVVILLLPIAVISFFHKEANFNLPKKQNVEEKNINYTITLKLEDGSTKRLDLEEYVIGVVAGEMPASFEMEALKAQAIASRTYALYKKSMNNDYDVTTTIADQVYITKEDMQNKWLEDFDKYYQKVSAAVDETKGLVIKYNNEIIKSYYFAMSNGYTEDAINVFNESQDYLVSVESSNENEITNNLVKTVELNKQDFCNKLDITCPKITINNIQKDSSNRIEQITINNKTFSGVEIRKLLNLRSTDFIINISNDNINITTKGYGHGVGMSQYGANAMAKNKANYEDILKHYYKDVTIESI